ncbi:Negative regulator of sigma E activity [Allopseudospirillum japonicum]|uniref:Negative regulator of sigma E activity n=1 Tax=Allopseudospirillum japonicum TaxID=64971 RepID=A0A1H6S9Z4_9GAMM|nr:MucB/RseB C-terminal domain-containing protein [Allopseudospirillum japonicum]SEI63626.1 Negative regulator of sigma E activity [Allopseudospirillum japonicum]
MPNLHLLFLSLPKTCWVRLLWVCVLSLGQQSLVYAVSNVQPAKGQAHVQTSEHPQTPEQTLLAFLNQQAQYHAQGILVFQKGTHLDTVHFRFQPHTNGHMYREWQHTNGLVRHWLQEGNQLQGRFAQHPPLPALVVPWANWQQALAHQWQHLRQYYTVLAAPAQRIANREAYCVRLQAQDIWRHGYQLCVDQQTGTPLRAAFVNQLDQGILERFEVVDLQYQALAPEEPPQTQVPDPQVPRVNQGEASHETQVPVTRHWQYLCRPHWIPQGFRLQSYQDQLIFQGRQLQQFFYTDGLAAFSVFVEPSQDAPITSGAYQTGASLALVQGIDPLPAKVPKLTGVLVGELPQISAQRILASLKCELRR